MARPGRKTNRSRKAPSTAPSAPDTSKEAPLELFGTIKQVFPSTTFAVELETATPSWRTSRAGSVATGSSCCSAIGWSSKCRPTTSPRPASSTGTGLAKPAAHTSPKRGFSPSDPEQTFGDSSGWHPGEEHGRMSAVVGPAGDQIRSVDRWCRETSRHLARVSSIILRPVMKGGVAGNHLVERTTCGNQDEARRQRPGVRSVSRAAFARTKSMKSATREVGR